MSDAPLECPGCGYDLRGVPVVRGRIRCPECGDRELAARAANMVPFPPLGRALAVCLSPQLVAAPLTLLAPGAIQLIAACCSVGLLLGLYAQRRRPASIWSRPSVLFPVLILLNLLVIVATFFVVDRLSQAGTSPF